MTLILACLVNISVCPLWNIQHVDLSVLAELPFPRSLGKIYGRLRPGNFPPKWSETLKCGLARANPKSAPSLLSTRTCRDPESVADISSATYYYTRPSLFSCLLREDTQEREVGVSPWGYCFYRGLTLDGTSVAFEEQNAQKVSKELGTFAQTKLQPNPTFI